MTDSFTKLVDVLGQFSQNAGEWAIDKIISDEANEEVYPVELDLPGGLLGMIIHNMRLGCDYTDYIGTYSIESDYHIAKRINPAYNKYDLPQRGDLDVNLGLTGRLYKSIRFEKQGSGNDSCVSICSDGYTNDTGQNVVELIHGRYGVTFRIPPDEYNKVEHQRIIEHIRKKLFEKLK